MATASLLNLALAVLLVLLAAFATLAETSFTALNRMRLRKLVEEGVPRAQAVDRLLERPHLALGSILLLKTLSIAGAVSLALWTALAYYGGTWPSVAVVLAAALAIAVGAELLPRSYAAQYPDRVALMAAPPVQGLAWVLMPAVRVASLLVDLALSLVGAKRLGEAPLVTEDELRLLVSMGEEEGIIEADEKSMIRGIFELEDTTARGIMVPRIDIAAVDTEASVPDAVDVIVRRGFSRIPLFEDTIDNIVGVLYAKDLLPYLRTEKPLPPLREIARKPHFIPESKKVDDLLHELQQTRVHMAIVVDEYGGTAGLVTIEDLLEEIVGEIQDEYDREEATVERVSENEAILDGRVAIDELNEIFGVDIEADSFDTVGGFVYNQLGKIPKPGDVVAVDGLSVSVLSTVGKRVKKVQVVRKPAA